MCVHAYRSLHAASCAPQVKLRSSFAVRTPLRFWIVLLGGSISCVGGPVSDWPSKSHDGPNGGRIPGVPHGGDDTEDSVEPNAPPERPASAGRMDAGAAAPPGEGVQASDAGADDAAVPCTATDAGACADPCEAVWHRVSDDDHDLAPDALARLGCDLAKLSYP
jgi:hypothetical protein